MTSEITELLAQAMRAIQYGHKQAAAAYLNRILEIDPDNMDAWRWLAECMPNQSKRDYCLERAGLSSASFQSRQTAYQRTSNMSTANSLFDDLDETTDNTLASKHAQRAVQRGLKRAELPPHYHTALSIDLDYPKTRENNRSSQNNPRQSQNQPAMVARRPVKKPRKGISFKGLVKSAMVIAIFAMAGYILFSTGITTGERVWRWITLQIENNLGDLPFLGENTDSTPASPFNQPAEQPSILATYFPTPTAAPISELDKPTDSSESGQDVRASAEIPVDGNSSPEIPVETPASAPAQANSAANPPENPISDTEIIDDSAEGYTEGDEPIDSNNVTFDIPSPSQTTDTSAAVQPVQTVSDTSAAEVAIPIANSPVVAQPTGFVDGPRVIGKSVKGNNLEIMQFGNGPVERMMVAGVHGGNEWNTTALADQLIEYIKKNPQVIPADRTLYILRLMNPDGEARGHNLDGRTNERGVDLNRNFDAFWVVDWPRDGCWNYRPISAGSSPFSEPETIAVRDFIQAHNISALVNYHSAALGLFAGGRPPETESVRLAKSIAAVTNYAYPPQDTGCKYTGQFTDWLAMNGIAAVDLELSNHTDTDFAENLKVLRVLMQWEPSTGTKTLTGLINLAQSIPEEPSTLDQIKKFGVQTLNKLNGIVFGYQEDK